MQELGGIGRYYIEKERWWSIAKTVFPFFPFLISLVSCVVVPLVSCEVFIHLSNYYYDYHLITTHFIRALLIVEPLHISFFKKYVYVYYLLLFSVPLTFYLIFTCCRILLIKSQHDIYLSFFFLLTELQH